MISEKIITVNPSQITKNLQKLIQNVHIRTI